MNQFPAEPAGPARPEGVIVAATDGACSGNPGPAGWSWVVSDTCWAAGGWTRSTNNVAELTAVLELLRATEPVRHLPLEILADSQYVIDALTKWVHGWRRRGWTTAGGAPVKNKDLIVAIDAALRGRQVRFTKVRGHATAARGGHVLNVAADARAVAAREQIAAGSPGPFGPGWVQAGGAR